MNDILFFDDALRASENELFEFQLRRTLREFAGEVIAERAIPRVEAALRMRPFRVVVLDVMAAMPGKPGLDAVAGLEILRRCRSGEYGSINRQTHIFIRTARAEEHIRRLAAFNGCNDYFMAGTDDGKLLAVIAELLRS